MKPKQTREEMLWQDRNVLPIDLMVTAAILATRGIAPTEVETFVQ